MRAVSLDDGLVETGAVTSVLLVLRSRAFVNTIDSRLSGIHEPVVLKKAVGIRRKLESTADEDMLLC